MNRRLQSVLLTLASLALVVVAYLLGWPVPIDPEAWEPPAAPPPIANSALATATRVEIAGGNGPEDIDVDAQGRVYMGLHDGRIVRFQADGSGQETFADTHGRPLGLHWDNVGNLLVADAHKGLLSIDPAGKITVLATEAGRRPFVFTDDLETTADGTIYFSDASDKFTQMDWKLDLLENRPNGRLLRFDPRIGKAEIVVDDLYFANGIAVAPDESFVLVAETSRYRVKRLWLTGEKKGQVDVLVDNLPGFPDGISTGTGGVFWIALGSPRNALVDLAGPRPWLRSLIVRLPAFVQPGPVRHTQVVGVDASGKIVHELADPVGTATAMLSSVQERGGKLYLGSLKEPAWAWISRPTGP